MNPQYEEHLRDSQFDDSRFAGWCRGDVYPALPRSAFDGDWEDIEFDASPVGAA